MANDAVPDRLSIALDSSWRDSSSPFQDFNFDTPSGEVLDLEDPETAMKEKRRTKRSIEPDNSGGPTERDESSFVLESLSLPQPSISEDPSVLHDPGFVGHQTSAPSHQAADLGYNIQSQPQPYLPKPLIHVSGPVPPRPASPSSAPSLQENAFNDFDGVHFAPANVVAHAQPEPPPRNTGMVYYPAPVPVMLNLPRKLRTGPSSGNDRAAKPSAPSNQNPPRNVSKRKDLHASLKFPEPGGPGGGSAVATLESILNAAADSSPSTFVQHPMAPARGGTRSQIYRDSFKPVLSSNDVGQGSRKSKVMSISQNDRSELPLGNEEDVERLPHNMGDEVYDINVVPPSPDTAGFPAEGREDLEDPNLDYLEDDQSAFEEIHRSEESDDYDDADLDLPPPSNLLAELESRKAKQRLRTRNAASAFPVGLRSTLLELDAVAEIERETRRKAQPALTWQNNDNAPKMDDEDVPLGMLYPTSAAAKKEDSSKPLGLLAVREMEENEPLSRRRQRLQGDAAIEPRALQQSRLTHYSTNLGYPSPDKKNSIGISQAPHLNLEIGQEEEEEEEETLGSRKKRLQEGHLRSGSQVQEMGNVGGDGDDAEESLAQRKQRLKSNPQQPQPQQSMNLSGQELAGFLDASFETGYTSGGGLQNTGPGRPHSFMTPGAISYNRAAQQYPDALSYSMVQLNRPPDLDERSREMVERWRTNVW